MIDNLSGGKIQSIFNSLTGFSEYFRMIFTKDMSVGDLKNCLGQPRYTAVRDRMRAIVLKRQGKTFREIAKTLNRSLDFVKSWNDRFKHYGAPGLDSSDHIVLVVDGAGWHHSKALNVPDNISILFLPPYSPELNPVERL